jgi:hypothetical protein
MNIIWVQRTARLFIPCANKPTGADIGIGADDAIQQD